MVTKFNKYDILKLEEFWTNHKENKKKLRFREFELLNPSREQDENTGGSSSSFISNPTERDAIRLSEDRLYQNLKATVKSVEDIYNALDEESKGIVNMRYWEPDGYCYEWDEIAKELNMSRSTVLRKRNLIVDEMAKRIGWF